MKRNMVISFIGRPNVGKSSLFNRLMNRQHKALTYDRPGVTRDRHYGIATLNEKVDLDPCDVILVDTGGFYPQKVDEVFGDKEEQKANKFFNIMTQHAYTAIEESDLVLFVVDAREGVLPFDRTIADFIRTQKRPFWLLVNKYDTDKQMGSEAEFHSLGVDQLFVLSAAHGLGVGELKERLHQRVSDFHHTHPVARFLQKGVTPRENVVGRLALIGAPNAGKSTLLNQLIGAERALVSDVPGTTVDPIEGFFDLYFGRLSEELDKEQVFSKDDKALIQQYDDFRKNNPHFFNHFLDSNEQEDDFLGERRLVCGERSEEEALEKKTIQSEEEIKDCLWKQAFEDSGEEASGDERQRRSFWRSLHLIDTAGIRKKSAVQDNVESQSVFRSLRCISESDIVLFLIDATQGIGHQDRRLLDIALEKGKSVIILLNKIDLLKDQLKTERERREWLEDLRYDVPWLNFCDLIPISAKHNKGLKKLRQAIIKTILVRRRSLSTGELNRVLYGLVERNPIVVQKSGGARFKVKYVSMVKSNPPTFLLFTNKSKGIPENYKRYLKNGLRQEFPLDNTPVHLIFKTSSDLSRRIKKVSRDRVNKAP